MRWITWLLAAALLVFAPPAAAVDVGGDDGNDLYVGSGGLILPASVGEETRRSVAGCPGCQWRLTEVCDGPCDGVSRGCPQGHRLVRSWISRTGAWEEIGLICLQDSGPVTVGDVGRGVRDQFIEGLPPLAPRSMPARGVLPRLPVVLDSGQPPRVAPSYHVVLGLSVVLSPTPRWTWECPGVRTFDTAIPGSVFPDTRVSCTFTRPGLRQVRVRTTWSAEFMVDGLGPFPVDEPVTQEAVIPVAVGQARAVLVGASR